MNRTTALLTALIYFVFGLGLYADDKPAPTKSIATGRDDIKETPLSPEAILDKKVEGKAAVEFSVGEAHTLDIDSVFMPGTSHAVLIRPKVANAKIDDELVVLVSRETATRLLRLGIEDPTEHFRGKLLRVTGNVERLKHSSNPSATTYRIQVTNLDQLESIRKP